MFTGIIEKVGIVRNVHPFKNNLKFLIESDFKDELQVDQSVSHNGVCLTVEEINDKGYIVTAIKETLEKSNIGGLMAGDKVNLERSMKLGGRLDGHIVQGHVDQVAACVGITEEDGSWTYDFEFEPLTEEYVVVEKGSITVNGVSLTAFNAYKGQFSVGIIPYTYEHTNFNSLKFGSVVNIEFDILGKYVATILAQRL
ncbi:MAG: riboflavin synthase [Patiriisocius sp.]|jgi:riboflavin synthase